MGPLRYRDFRLLWSGLVLNGTALIGPVIGGSAISMTGAAGSFFVQAFLLVIVVLCTFLLRAPVAQLEARQRSMSRSVLDGLRYVYDDPFMFAMFGIEAMTMSFAMYVQILPVFARDVLEVGPTGLGFLYAAPGVGAVIASAAMLTIGDVKKKGQLFMVTALAKPVAAAIFALSTSMPLSMLMLGLVGLLDVAGGTVRTTILQLSTAQKMLGRVMSMDLIIHRGLGTLNGIPLGAMASVAGAPFALAGGSITVLIYAVSAFMRVPSLHRYPED